MILYASKASRQPIKFGVGPITGGTPEVTLFNDSIKSALEAL